MRVKARRLARNLVFTLAMLLLTLGVIEVMARLTHHLLFGEGVASSLERLAERIVAPGSAGTVHPFYGFVLSGSSAGWTSMPPEERRRGALLVALLGGSVARDVAGELRNALFRHFLEIGLEGVPVLVDLSARGYHQPQQAVVLANMMANGAQFDIVVVLDGFNDVTRHVEKVRDGIHPSFTGHWYSLVSMSAEQMAIVGHLLELRDEERNLLEQLDADGLLSRSAVWRVIWRFRLARVEHRIVLGHHELMAGRIYRLEKHGPRGRYTDDYLRTVGPRLWHDGSRLIAGLAERHGAEYYHFIQPNQHVPNSKPFSADELAMFNRTLSRLGEQLFQKTVPEGYGQMREYGDLLREIGVHFFDLSWIYQDHPETLYRDFCCHLNKRGNELLAAAMLRRIIGQTSYGEKRSSEGDGLVAPVERSAFDVFHLGTALGYAKTPCTPADVQETFFLHVTPVHEDDLPSHRSKHGFDNLDFGFARWGTVFGDRCVAVLPLPDYPVARVRTGQGGAVPWDVEFSW